MNFILKKKPELPSHLILTKTDSHFSDLIDVDDV